MERHCRCAGSRTRCPQGCAQRRHNQGKKQGAACRSGCARQSAALTPPCALAEPFLTTKAHEKSTRLFRTDASEGAAALAMQFNAMTAQCCAVYSGHWRADRAAGFSRSFVGARLGWESGAGRWRAAGVATGQPENALTPCLVHKRLRCPTAHHQVTWFWACRVAAQRSRAG